MRAANRFWRALEATPGQADVMAEWRRKTGEDFDLTRRFLRPTDRRARVFRCPSPGGEGCPRQVVVHGHGDIVAACANVERSCDDLQLAEADIVVHALDRRKLGAVVADCLELDPAFAVLEGVRDVFRVGEDAVFAGKRVPAFVAFPTHADRMRGIAMRLASTVNGPFLFLTPTGRHLSSEIGALLAHGKAQHLPLVDLLAIDDNGHLRPVEPAERLLAGFRASIAPEVPSSVVPELFPTPTGASWEGIVIEFHADEVALVRCGSVTRRVEPEQMGMKSRKSGRPTLQWTLLRTLARTGGIIPLQSPKDHDRVKKQKSELSRKLKTWFQLPEEPIVWKPGEYQWEAAFRIRAVNLRESAEEAST